jgi:hypothetical protein
MIENRQNLRIYRSFHLHIWLHACIFSLGWCKFILKEVHRSIAELQISRICKLANEVGGLVSILRIHG